MRFAGKSQPIHTVWHSWFAWHPVRVGREWVFLEKVERRLQWISSYDGIGAKWFYR